MFSLIPLVCSIFQNALIPQRPANFKPLVSFHTTWKLAENQRFSDISGGMERDQWHEICQRNVEAYPEFRQTFRWSFFAKLVNGCSQKEGSILDAWQGSEYVSWDG